MPVRAVIDVGTNSVKLLVADTNGRSVRPVYESSQQTRLGQGFYESHILQAGPIRETAKAVADFCAMALAHGAGEVRVIATSAARDARNQDELLGAITRASGLVVAVISGETEADWAYRGVTSDPGLAATDLLVMDVGGGSTEFILGRGGHRRFGESFAMGSVRFLERLGMSDPPAPGTLALYEQEIDRMLRDEVSPRLSPRLDAPVQLTGTGGTSTILARIKLRQEVFDRDEIERTVLSRDDVQRQKQHLWSLPLEARRGIVGLPANRADVILPGMLIFERVMATFGFNSLRASTRGIRFAALMD